MAWLRSEHLAEAELSELQSAYRRGVSQGTWHSMIRALERYGARHASPLPGSVISLRPAKGEKGFVSDLRILLEERNRWAHGARPHSKAEAAERVSQLFGPLERVLMGCDFLTSFPWIITQSSSYRRHQRDFEIIAQKAMGDHPEFESIRVVSAAPLADDTFYVILPKGPVDLTPLIVTRYCERCRQREVCYADRIDEKHGVALKSFSTGYVVHDRALEDEILHLARRGEAVAE